MGKIERITKSAANGDDDQLREVLSERARIQMDEFRASHHTKVLTIFFSDLVGSTRQQDELGNDYAAALVEKHRAIFRATLAKFVDGREIETAGDSFLAVFDAPSDGVWFALQLQANMRSARIYEPDLPGFRIGLHQGQVVIGHTDGSSKPMDIYGIQVSVASRIMGFGCGGQILCSRAVFDDAKQSLTKKELDGLERLEWRLYGSYRLKGVRAAQEIGEVGEKGKAPFKRPPGRLIPRIPLLLGSAALACCLISAIWLFLSGPALVLTDIRPEAKAIAERAKEIHQDNAAVQNSLQVVQQTAKRVETNAAKTAVALDAVVSGFDALSKQGGLISNPSTPQEVYHNARLYQLNGDSQNARKAFEQFFAFKLDFTDPHIEYVKLLKAQDGHAAALHSYEELAKSQGTLSAECAWISLMEDPQQRIQSLERLAVEHPEHGPVFYQLSSEFSHAAPASQTLAQSRAEKAALEQFLNAERAGNVYRYFLDKAVADHDIADAKNRYQQVAAIPTETIDKPVQVQFGINAPDTMMISIKVAEDTTKVEYRWDEDKEFTPFDLHRVLLANPQKRRTFYVRYWDAAGTMQGPYQFPFEPKNAMLGRHIEDLDDELKMSMVGPGDIAKRDDGYYLDLTTLRESDEHYRESGPALIDSVLYSFDSADLNQRLELSSAAASWAIPIPAEAQFLTLQVLYSDGTKSAIRQRKIER